MKLKITGGAFKGRYIEAPTGKTTRPTSEKLRKSIFDICQNYIENAVVLDLFSGSGAMGLEAISRGAKTSYLVDNELNAQKCILQNINYLGVANEAHLLRIDVLKAIDKLETDSNKFDLIFIDPPYATSSESIILAEKTLYKLDNSSLITASTVIFLEEGRYFNSDRAFSNLKNLKLRKLRTYGDSNLYEIVIS